MGRDLYQRESSGYDRALGFFDAVYGFSLTLLIANLDAPPAEAWQSFDALLAQDVGNQLFGFLISFVVIAAFWRVNHRTIDRLSTIDSRVILLNILAAGLVIFIPFTTQGISDSETSDLPLPLALYAVNIAAAMLAQSLIVFTARQYDQDAHPLNARQWGIQVLDAMVGPLVFLASVPVAYAWGGDTAKFCWLLLIVLGPLSARLSQRAITALAPEPPPEVERRAS